MSVATDLDKFPNDSASGLYWMGTIPSPRTARGEGGICGSPPPSTHNALFQRNELLFLFLPLFEVYVDERLQLQEIFLHALPVDVLRMHSRPSHHPPPPVQRRVATQVAPSAKQKGQADWGPGQGRGHSGLNPG